MLRFDESQTLDRIAEAGGIDDALARKLAETIVAMHARAAGCRCQYWIAALESFLEQNAAAFREVSALFPPDVAAKLDHGGSFRASKSCVLFSPAAAGAASSDGATAICTLATSPCCKGVRCRSMRSNSIRDVAAGDLLYDLAFLLMDLLERGLGRAANIVFNGYFARMKRLEDLDGLAALPFFMSLRAAIRAKVTAARLQYAGPRTKIPKGSCKVYFRLAAELLSPPPPMLIAIGGLSGTGKSSVARELAPHVRPLPGALLLRSDVERKTALWGAETEHLPADAYSVEVSTKVYGTTADKAARTIGAGHSAIVDAVFAKPDERAAIAAVASAGTPFSWTVYRRRSSNAGSTAWGREVSMLPMPTRRSRSNGNRLRLAPSNGP